MRRITLVLTWLLVTVAATAVAWTTVGHLTPGAGGRTAPAMSPNAVDAALRNRGAATVLPSVPPSTEPGSPGATPAGDGAGSGTPVVSAPPVPGPAPATGSPRPSTGSGSATGSRTPAPAPAPAPAPTPAAGTDDHGGSSSGPGPGSSSPTTTTTAAPARSAVIQSTGGVVTVSCSGSTITLVSSSPRNGYSQEIEEAGPQEVKVRYRSSEHQSEIQVVCRNGSPSAEVNESGEGSG